MAEHVCPPWLGWMLVSPLRKLVESPRKMLADQVTPGMKILEPGPAMGFFTLPLAQMTGPEGQVVAVDIQQTMLDRLKIRAQKAGLAGRIDLRLGSPDSLAVDDLAGSFDLAVVIHMLHETGDQAAFLDRLAQALKPGGKLLIKEPPGHVKEQAWKLSLDLAQKAGFKVVGEWGKRGAVLRKEKEV